MAHISFRGFRDARDRWWLRTTSTLDSCYKTTPRFRSCELDQPLPGVMVMKRLQAKSKETNLSPSESCRRGLLSPERSNVPGRASADNLRNLSQLASRACRNHVESRRRKVNITYNQCSFYIARLFLGWGRGPGREVSQRNATCMDGIT